MLENAKFEEIVANPQKARKIYEKLTIDIAPGLIKAMLERINFEKREKNFDRAKELYSITFTQNLTKCNPLAVTVVAIQYSRFLSQKCHEHKRALDILEQAVSAKDCANKILYLNYINLAKLHPDTQNLVPKIYEKAIS